jgi:hypothetical protein
MKIGKKFNQLNISEYKHYIQNHEKYIDFNTLGLFRSIIENERLALADKIIVRDFANQFFLKTFNFLQIKDPFTYFKLITLGENLTKGDEKKIWNQIKENQKKILKDKRIKHRNFGIYSKHCCGYETCSMDGLMIKQGSYFSEHELKFDSDRNKFTAKLKVERFRKMRKKENQKINSNLTVELFDL